MLGLTLNYKSRTAPYTAGVIGYVDGAGYVTPADTGDTGLPASTALAQALDRKSIVVEEAIRASATRQGGSQAGTKEPTSFRLPRRPYGADVLTDLIGKELNGLEAELWEIGTLNDVVYTITSPKIWHRGIVSGWDLGSEEAVGQIQAPGTGLSDQALDRYPGWGNGLLFDGSSATVRWEIFDPSGDWTISALHLMPYERWNSSTTTRIMVNGDITMSRVNRGYRITVAHASTNATVTSGDVPRPERFYMVRAKYTASTKTVELFIDAVSQGTHSGTGAITQSGLAWAFGSNQAQSANWDESIMGQWRFFDGTIADVTSDEQEEGPLDGDETDLYADLRGWTNAAGTLVYDYAEVNAAAPLNGTITAATQATMCGGSLREASDTVDSQDAAGAQMQWPLGPARHVLCVPIDADNYVFQVCNPLRGVQDFEAVYQGGAALDITHRVTSWIALYAVTLAGSGDCAVYPQGGGVLLHTRTSGAVTADVLGGGPWVRGLKFDGDDSVDLGTGINAMLISNFSIVFSVDVVGDVGVIADSGLAAKEGIRIDTFLSPTTGAVSVRCSIARAAGPTPEVSVEVPPGTTATFLWAVDVTAGDQYLYKDDILVDGDSTVVPVVASGNLYLGRLSTSASQFWEGTLSNLEIYSETKTLAWHIRNLHRPQITRLDADGVAADESGGLVSLPAANHGYIAGESVDITGAHANYNGTGQTLHANTTKDKLWITATYAAFTADGYSEKVIDSTLEHVYPGSTWDFDASTLADEGVGTAADGTITGATHVGGVAPTSPRSLITYVAKAGGVRHVDVDLSKTTDWPSASLDWSKRTSGR